MDEIIGFLSHPRKDVRLVAANHLAGLSAAQQDPEMAATLAKNRPALAKALVNNLGSSLVRHMTAPNEQDSDKDVTHEVFRTLVNLSQTSEFVDCLIDLKTPGNKDIVDILLTMLNSPNYIFCEFVCMLLSNISRNLRVCDRIVSLDISSQGKQGLGQLVSLMTTCDDSKGDPYRWLSTVIVNVSRVNTAATILLEHSRGLIKSFLVMLDHKDLIRKGGAISLIRNLLFDKSRHEYLVFEAHILPYLLLPIAGPEEFTDDETMQMYDELQYLPSDKKREADASIRLLIVECLKLLCQTRLTRDEMRKHNVYLILREFDKSETEEKVKDSLYSVISLLIMEEKPVKAQLTVVNSNDATSSTETKQSSEAPVNEPAMKDLLEMD